MKDANKTAVIKQQMQRNNSQQVFEILPNQHRKNCQKSVATSLMTIWNCHYDDSADSEPNNSEDELVSADRHFIKTERQLEVSFCGTEKEFQQA